MTCPLCNGAGYLRRDLPVTDPDFGKAIPCECLLPRQIERYKSLSGITEDWTFSSFPGDTAAKKAAIQATKTRQGIWVFYNARHGVGKSGLLIAVVKAAWEKNIPAWYLLCADMLDMLRDSFRTNSFESLFEELKTVPILAIDEFDRWYSKGDGGEGSPSWASQVIFQVVDWRYRYWQSRLTLIATNKEREGEEDAITSRFGDTLRAHLIHVEGNDLRPLAKQLEGKNGQ